MSGLGREIKVTVYQPCVRIISPSLAAPLPLLKLRFVQLPVNVTFDLKLSSVAT